MGGNDQGHQCQIMIIHFDVLFSRMTLKGNFDLEITWHTSSQRGGVTVMQNSQCFSSGYFVRI